MIQCRSGDLRNVLERTFPGIRLFGQHGVKLTMSDYLRAATEKGRRVFWLDNLARAGAAAAGAQVDCSPQHLRQILECGRCALPARLTAWRVEFEDRVAHPRAVCGAAIGELGVASESRL